METTVKRWDLALQVINFNAEDQSEPGQWRKYPIKAANAPAQLCSMEDRVLYRDVYGNVFTVDVNGIRPFSIPGKVAQIASGPRHAIFLLTTGQLLVWGENKFGQCGVEGNTSVTRAQPPDILEPKHRAKYIAAGADRSAAIMSDGRIIIWGGQHLALSGVATSVTQFGPEHFDNTEVKRIALGDTHGAAIDIEGRLWHWGDFGPLSRKAGLHPVTEPVEVSSAVWGTIVTRIACGNDFTAVITADGGAFMYGRIPAKFASEKLINDHSCPTHLTEKEENNQFFVFAPWTDLVPIGGYLDWASVCSISIPRCSAYDRLVKCCPNIPSAIRQNPASVSQRLIQTLKDMDGQQLGITSGAGKFMSFSPAPLSSLLGTSSTKRVFPLAFSNTNRLVCVGRNYQSLDTIVASQPIAFIAQSSSSVVFVSPTDTSVSDSTLLAMDAVPQNIPSMEQAHQLRSSVSMSLVNSLLRTFNKVECEKRNKKETTDEGFESFRSKAAPRKTVVQQQPEKPSSAFAAAFDGSDDDASSTNSESNQATDQQADQESYNESEASSAISPEQRSMEDEIDSPAFIAWRHNNCRCLGEWLVKKSDQTLQELVSQMGPDNVNSLIGRSDIEGLHHRHTDSRYTEYRKILTDAQQSALTSLETLPDTSFDIRNKHFLSGLLYDVTTLQFVSDCLASHASFQRATCIAFAYLQWVLRRAHAASTEINHFPTGEELEAQAMLDEIEDRSQLAAQLTTSRRRTGNKARHQGSRRRGERGFGDEAPEEDGARLKPEDVIRRQSKDSVDDDHVEGIGYSGKRSDVISGGGYVTREHAAVDSTTQFGHQAEADDNAALRLLGQHTNSMSFDDVGSVVSEGSSESRNSAWLLLGSARNKPYQQGHDNSATDNDEIKQLPEDTSGTHKDSKDGASQVSALEPHQRLQMKLKRQVRRNLSVPSNSISADQSVDSPSTHLAEDIKLPGILDPHAKAVSDNQEGREDWTDVRELLEVDHQWITSTAIDRASKHAVESLRHNIAAAATSPDVSNSTSALSRRAAHMLSHSDVVEQVILQVANMLSCESETQVPPVLLEVTSSSNSLLAVAAVLWWAWFSTRGFDYHMTHTNNDEGRDIAIQAEAKEVISAIHLYEENRSDMINFLEPYIPCFERQVASNQVPSHFSEILSSYFALPPIVKYNIQLCRRNEKGNESPHLVSNPFLRCKQGIYEPISTAEVLRNGASYSQVSNHLKTSLQQDEFVQSLSSVLECVVADADLACASSSLTGRNWWETRRNERTNQYAFEKFVTKVQSELDVQYHVSSPMTPNSPLFSPISETSLTEQSEGPSSPYGSQSQLSPSKQSKNIKQKRRKQRARDRTKWVSAAISQDHEAQIKRATEARKTIATLGIEAAKGILITPSAQVIYLHDSVVLKRIPQFSVYSTVCNESDIHSADFLQSLLRCSNSNTAEQASATLQPGLVRVYSLPPALQDLPDSLVAELIAYIYTGNVKATATTALPLLVMAAALKLEDLRRSAEFYLLLSGFCSADTALSMLQLAVQTSSRRLGVYAATVAVKHCLKEVTQSRGVSSSALQSPKRFVQSDQTTGIPAESLFNILAQAQCQKRISVPQEREIQTRPRTFSVGDVSTPVQQSQTRANISRDLSVWSRPTRTNLGGAVPHLIDQLRASAGITPTNSTMPISERRYPTERHDPDIQAEDNESNDEDETDEDVQFWRIPQ